jgi:hypothetical protein
MKKLILVMAGIILNLASEAQRPLTLAIEIEKTSYVLGEPVYLTARLRNSGSSAVRVPIALNPTQGYLHVQVTDPQERRRAVVPLAVLDDDSSPAELAAGSEVAEVFPIFFGARGWTFSQPGKYAIEAMYRAPGKEQPPLVRSNTVNITVEKGDGAGELLINSGAASQDAGKFLFWQSGDHLRRGLALLEDVMNRYPESILVDYVRAALGHNLSRAFQDYEAGRVRPPNCMAAVEQMRRVTPTRLPTYLQVRNRLSEASCLVTMGQGKQAKPLLAEARKIIEGNPAFHTLLERLGRIERAVEGLPTAQ